jgi:anthranilate synthase component I
MQVATPGHAVPLVERVRGRFSPIDVFTRISNYGRNKHCLLLESAEIVKKYGEHSVAAIDPCLYIKGRADKFSIKALNERGRRMLPLLKDRLAFCDAIRLSGDNLSGKLVPVRGNVSESERLRLPNHADILRALAFFGKPVGEPVGLYGGLFGMLAYDFIDQFEDLPPNRGDLTLDPDYEAYLADRVFDYDHQRKVLRVIATVYPDTGDPEALYEEAQDDIKRLLHLLKNPGPVSQPRPTSGKLKTTTDTAKAEFMRKVERLKEHILAGDVFQAVLSRTICIQHGCEPFEIYRHLRELNPSPYMFYFNTPEGILLGASPERCVGVDLKSSGVREVEIRPIAGTKPRGLINGKVDPDLDSRYAIELATDFKELAEHTMLVDLARNDVARIAVPGTRVVVEPFYIEKYSHVQHIVSSVKGVLKPELDPLHAYLATMNMGTLSGAPKIEAMKLLRKYEKNRRGYYGGAVFYLTPGGQLDSTITIRTLRIKGDTAYLRVGAGVVHDSIPKSEYEETEKKAGSCLAAIRSARGESKS